MVAGRTTEMEGTTPISGYTLDIIEYMQYCYERMDSGRENEIIGDPWYTPRRGPISEETVDKLIEEMDHEFSKEIDGFPSYHFRRSGANATPDFRRLGPTARRAMAEGLLRIIEEWDDWNTANGLPVATTPQVNSYDYDWYDD